MRIIVSLIIMYIIALYVLYPLSKVVGNFVMKEVNRFKNNYKN